jgi:peptidoglycan/LPS O-acetylase OafA/YrhL
MATSAGNTVTIASSHFRSLICRPGPTTLHYHSMDLLRGFAAIAVLFWHYGGFYAVRPGDIIPPDVLSHQPLFYWFQVLYTRGYFAVQLFWAISGFVFSAVYSDSQASTREFAVARFARLYPLHFVTLIVVTVLEIISIRTTGFTKCYDNFDLYHFFLNLFFVSSWGLEHGFSFNGPIWSVSIEIPIYVLFWIMHRPLFARGILGPFALTTLFAIAVAVHMPGYLWTCGLFFFSGASIYVLHRALRRGSQVSLALLLLLSCVFAPWQHLSPLVSMGILATVMLVAGAESTLGGFAKSMRWIGDNTYGVYLWQIPIQIQIMLMVKDTRIYDSPLFLIAYLCVVTVIARASFLLIETPARKLFRQRLSAPQNP